MKHALVIILGAALSLFVRPSVEIMIFLGFVAGAVAQGADMAFPAPQKPYIAPQNRPKPATRKAQLIGVTALTILGALLLAFAFLVPLPRPWMQLNGAFLGAACLGAALAVLAMGKKSRETHNAWLAAMTPNKPLDFES